MQQYFIFIAFVLFLSGCADKRISYGVNSNSGIVKTFETYFDGVEINGKYYTTSEEKYMGPFLSFYNPDGTIREKHAFNEDASLNCRMVYTYNEEGLEKMVTYSPDSLAGPAMEFESLNGKVILEKRVKEFSLAKNILIHEIKKFYYDGDVLTSSETLIDDDLVSSFENFFIGDSIINRIYYDSLGQVTSTKIMELDSNKIITSVKELDENGVMLSEHKQKFEYDEKNNWVRWIMAKEDKVSIVQRTIYYQEDLEKNSLKNDIVGNWSEVEGSTWIRFKTNGSYDWGSQEKKVESGKWKVLSNNAAISFTPKSSTESREFLLEFDDDKMIFLTSFGMVDLELAKE